MSVDKRPQVLFQAYSNLMRREVQRLPRESRQELPQLLNTGYYINFQPRNCIYHSVKSRMKKMRNVKRKNVVQNKVETKNEDVILKTLISIGLFNILRNYKVYKIRLLRLTLKTCH